MKNIFFLLSLLFVVASCEDVVTIPLNAAAPKLVIDANIKWLKTTNGANQTIKLSLTSDFYSNIIPPANGATVFVTTSANTVYNFIEMTNTGEYKCSNFVPAINETYTLTVNYQGQTYIATDKLLPTPPILNVQQETLPSFTGTRIEVKFFFQDNGATINYYLVNFKNSTELLPRFLPLQDDYFQGNLMFGRFSNESLKTGDNLFMSVQSISNRYFTYFQKLNELSGTSGGAPFSTPPATIRGNIVNQSDINNFPLGYFAVTEIDSRNYIVQ